MTGYRLNKGWHQNHCDEFKALRLSLRLFWGLKYLLILTNSYFLLTAFRYVFALDAPTTNTFFRNEGYYWLKIRRGRDLDLVFQGYRDFIMELEKMTFLLDNFNQRRFHSKHFQLILHELTRTKQSKQKYT